MCNKWILVVIWNMNPELYHEAITSLKTKQKKTCEEARIQRQILWDYCCLETNHFLRARAARRQIVHRGDVTLPLYSSGWKLDILLLFWGGLLLLCVNVCRLIAGWNYAVKRWGYEAFCAPLPPFPPPQWQKRGDVWLPRPNLNTKGTKKEDKRKAILWHNSCLLWKKSWGKL